MYKKKITYTDFDGVERSENFYFNLTQTELFKMETGNDLSMTDYINRIMDAKDMPKVIELFDEIVKKSYGIKSDDGRTFKKSKEIAEDFMASAAYDELYMSFFAGDNVDGALADFINGIMPKNLMDEAKKRGLLETGKVN